MNTHPCMTCGACCAFFRVLFHWSETLADSHQVPLEFIEKASPHLNAMKGTNRNNPRCMALEGEVARQVFCRIYENRPSCCRNFRASYEKGKRNHRCDEARLAKGLKPLKPKDWTRHRRIASGA